MQPDDIPHADFHISTDRSLLNFDFIFNYLSFESYWAKNISKPRLISAIENSLCFGIYKNTEQVGFARVITDQATFAYVCDVFMAEHYRGLGLSKKLMESITAFPVLQGLRRWTLATADAHGLYKQYGFQPLIKPENWMEIFKPYLSPGTETSN